MRKFLNRFSNPARLSFLNFNLILAATLINVYFQVFCRPSIWATIVLIICFLNTIFYPLLFYKKKLFYVSNYISGISFGVFIYCIVFLGKMNIAGILIVVGIPTFIPHFFVIQLFYKHFIGYKDKITKLCFSMGILTFLLAAFIFSIQYKNALVSMEQFRKNNFTSLDKNFMAEKILGMYFIYHTEFCEFDGWRPPIHEPALVIGQWFHGRQDPLTGSETRLDLKERILLYKKYFPEEKVKLNCSCAITYSEDYHTDKLFQTE